MKKYIHNTLFISSLYAVSLSPAKATGIEFSTTALGAAAGTAVYNVAVYWWNNPNECNRRVRIMMRTIADVFTCGRTSRTDLDSSLSHLYPLVMPLENARLLNTTCNSLERVCPAQFHVDLGDGYEYRTEPYTYQLRQARDGDPEFANTGDVSPAVREFMRTLRARANAAGVLNEDYFTRIDRAHETVVDDHHMIQYAMSAEDSSTLFVRVHAGEEQTPFIFLIRRNDEAESAITITTSAAGAGGRRSSISAATAGGGAGGALVAASPTGAPKDDESAVTGATAAHVPAMPADEKDHV